MRGSHSGLTALPLGANRLPPHGSLDRTARDGRFALLFLSALVPSRVPSRLWRGRCLRSRARVTAKKPRTRSAVLQAGDAKPALHFRQAVPVPVPTDGSGPDSGRSTQPRRHASQRPDAGRTRCRGIAPAHKLSRPDVVHLRVRPGEAGRLDRRLGQVHDLHAGVSHDRPTTVDQSICPFGPRVPSRSASRARRLIRSPLMPRVSRIKRAVRPSG